MNNMQKEGALVAIFGLLFVISVLMALNSKMPATGYATESSATSNVTISKYLSISLSTNLSNGLTFGQASSLPVTNLNATYNYDGAPAPNGSSMFINVSTDSNTAVDFCIKANNGLFDSAGGNLIGLNNETYHNSSTTSFTLPGLETTAVALTTSYVKSSTSTGRGNVTYFRFWLDIPAAQPSGDYNNSITFKGVETTLSC